MKRSCKTCLWWPTDSEYEVCRNPDAYGSNLSGLSYWCAKWEPRDRSLVRCETCDHAVFTTNNEDGICLLNPPQVSANGAVYAQVWRRSRCSHWRLREKQDNGQQ